MENIIYWIRLHDIIFFNKINKIKIRHKKSFIKMNSSEISQFCKKNDHIECNDCMCKCHIPGTMENLAKKIAKLDKNIPGIGETI